MRVEGLLRSPNSKSLSLLYMFLQNNAIPLREIQQRVVEHYVNFERIKSVILSTVACVLQHNRVRIKQEYPLCATQKGLKIYAISICQ